MVEPRRASRDLLLDADHCWPEMQLLAENEWAMYKPRWDAFYATPLETHLRDLRVKTVIVTGCNFPNCPRATIYAPACVTFGPS